MGVHGVIEFGNRMLTFAVGLIALATVLAVLAHRPRRPGLLALAVAVFLGIPAQAVIGGITVLTNLNPWVVGLHFLASMAVIAAAYALWRRIVDPDGPAVAVVPAPLRTLARITTGVSVAVLVVGTWVTGSGPHAGDHGAARNGLDPESISQVHADVVFLLIGLSVALIFAFRAVGAQRATRAAIILIAVELGQGLIGFVQYFTHVPALLVGAHMLGSCLVLLASPGGAVVHPGTPPGGAGAPVRPDRRRHPGTGHRLASPPPGHPPPASGTSRPTPHAGPPAPGAKIVLEPGSSGLVTRQHHYNQEIARSWRGLRR